MRSILTPAQKAANALKRAERALRDWQDDPASPRRDVDKMLAALAELRMLVQAHLLEEIEKRAASPPSNR
ncbi:MAG TPA: hypothetical protein VKV18_00745 [Chthonomonas sp.]|uniref:hypothetical protein n=1 Tax=Chthonomonas sp. TaxID=2282153 RepID=UPI002B4B451E|nr:hypothetical protein [Chthonomonas sp.]HLI47206.1 hypothetical protein [Chthonomonas sp.]